ncbi:phosphotransferase family protein [Prescottella subtropica]|uniref:phosphotransferase family protein n=1 Tax=Prescottella subtropica TaxID=2545757 RepID=UPI0010F96F62|nr:aminoglycoside phosphotransferase family protein [Prescottella subtropica]
MTAATARPNSTSSVPAEMVAALRRQGLADPTEHIHGVPVTGGVSSDVWRIDLPSGPVCLKRALPKLKVTADWRAPTTRAQWEARWLGMAGSVQPPILKAFDRDTGVLILEWLEPGGYPVWKNELIAGHVDVRFAGAVGDSLARLHAVGTHEDLGGWAQARPLFETLRIAPYFRSTARAHPECASRLADVIESLEHADVTVIHGDISPKNILTGPGGPVFLDAECASLGDPAFDIAFCLNHLLLKAVWMPDRVGELHTAADALLTAYAATVDWEDSDSVVQRMLMYLPALALARIDGMSPVEYLDNTNGRPVVRAAAVHLLNSPARTFDSHIARWASLTSTNG